MTRRRLIILLASGALLGVATLEFRHWLRAHGLSVGEFATEMRRGDDPRFTWKSVDKKHWQAESQVANEATALTDTREGTSAGCTAGMVRVKGAFRREAPNGQSTGTIERLQDAACTDWISKEFPARCAAFDKAKIAEEVSKLPTDNLDFCIDRFEYPNVFGQNPMIVATFREAEAICKKDSKRLCTENEWTFACEGEEVKPYPYGYVRDDTACVIDRSWRPFAEGALQPRDGEKAKEELDRLWQGEPSGSRPTCRSSFGVYDLTGNVDEWTRTVNTTGYSSILKGGYWGPVRARCRPSTRAHNEDFVAYQQSFRCCGESNKDIAPPPPVAAAISSNDAGTPSAVLANDGGMTPDAGRVIPVPDLDVEHPDPDQDDELTAIERARSVRCSVSWQQPTPHDSSLIGLAAIVGGLFTLRRKARHRSG